MAYRVCWEIDLDEPETPLAAAREAHAIMLDPDSTATVFTVTAPDSTTSMVDLLSADSPSVGLVRQSQWWPVAQTMTTTLPWVCPSPTYRRATAAWLSG